MVYSFRFETPLGQMLAAAQEDQLVGVWFTNQKYFPEGHENWTEKEDYPIFKTLKEWMKSYFDGKAPTVKLPLNPQGTDFQKTVWQYLLEIPYGTTATYGEIAQKVALEMNKPSMSAQAVGGAIGRNPISIIIPCHRVVGANHALTGYAGGLDKKEALLRLEAKYK